MQLHSLLSSPSLATGARLFWLNAPPAVACISSRIHTFSLNLGDSLRFTLKTLQLWLSAASSRILHSATTFAVTPSNHHHQSPRKMEPPLTEAQAFGLLTAYTIVYVLPLYASSKTRASPDRSRDAPEAIRARILTVSLSTTACSLATFFILRHGCSGTACSPLRLMGYWPLGMMETLKTCFLTGVLFAAPLYECLVVDGVWREWVDGLEPLRQVWAEWPAWRNYVVGPITEECLFRAAAVPLLLMAGSSLGRVIFLSPVVFGLAHVHHFYEFRVTHPETPLVAAIARSVLQFAYTSLFGALANFLFLRTGSLLAVVLVHTFCNSMGLPRVWGSVEPYWLSQADASRSRQAVLWSGIYYVLLFGGAYAWWRNLYTLTESPLALTVF